MFALGRRGRRGGHVEGLAGKGRIHAGISLYDRQRLNFLRLRVAASISTSAFVRETRRMR